MPNYFPRSSSADHVFGHNGGKIKGGNKTKGPWTMELKAKSWKKGQSYNMYESFLLIEDSTNQISDTIGTVVAMRF